MSFLEKKTQQKITLLQIKIGRTSLRNGALEMIRDFYLLFFSSLLLIFSVFSYYRYDVKSTELEGNIIYNPFQKNEWKERINTFLSYWLFIYMYLDQFGVLRFEFFWGGSPK